MRQKKWRVSLSRLRDIITSRRFLIRAASGLFPIIVLQLLFPYDRALPFSRIDAQSVGFKTVDEIKQLVTYETATVTTSWPTSVTTFKEAGISPQPQRSAERATNYPVWQRFIPLSIVYKIFNHEYESVVTYQDLPLSQWSKKVSEACYRQPKDASIAIIGDQSLAVVPSKSGYECKTSDLLSSIKSTKLSHKMSVDTKRMTAYPKRTDQAVSAQLGKIEVLIKQRVRVSVLDTETVAEPAEIIEWLTFSDGKNGELIVDVDPLRMQPFIERVQSPVYVQPGTTIISLQDGVETGRLSGAPGRGIDGDKLIETVRTQFKTLKSQQIAAEITNMPPRQQFNRSYTNSKAGLQALLNDLAAEKGDMAIAITELGGQGRSLNANGAKQYHPASTYKLFIAYSVIKRIEAGQLKWDDQVNGKSVDACMTTMIIDSDNACAESFAEKFSWKSVQSELRLLGLNGTDVNRAEPVSTVMDQGLFLKKLYDNQLMKPENRDKLLVLMKQQRFRAGIPAGVSYEVADKVGFLSGLLHDSAIVYAPNGGYVISIYSDGGSWAKIADATRRINTLINS